MKRILGQKIKTLRPLSKLEMEELDISRTPTVIELENGVLLLPIADVEVEKMGELLVIDGNAYNIITQAFTSMN